MSLIKLKILNFFSSIMRLLKKDIDFWVRLLKNIIFKIMSTRLFAVNLIFDQVIICKNSIWIKYFTSESLLLTWYNCLFTLSKVVASLLTSIKIRLLIYHDIKLLDLNDVELISASVKLESLVSADVKLLSCNSVITDVELESLICNELSSFII